MQAISKTTKNAIRRYKKKIAHNKYVMILINKINNGTTICPYHHKFGKLSAHRNQLWFSEWLKENFNDLWKLAIQRLRGSEK